MNIPPNSRTGGTTTGATHGAGSGAAMGARGGPPARYPRAEFDACYWRLADLCEQTLTMPLAQAWPIMDAFNQLAEIGTPRYLQVADPTQPDFLAGHPAPRDDAFHATPHAAPDGLTSGPGVDVDALAAEVLGRVAGLAIRAGTLHEVMAWGRIGDLLTTAFPDLHPPASTTSQTRRWPQAGEPSDTRAHGGLTPRHIQRPTIPTVSSDSSGPGDPTGGASA